MTQSEKDQITAYLEYLSRHYAVSLPKEEFLSDMEKLSSSKDTIDGAVNYQNIYKKYLKMISNQAFHAYISLENPLQDMKADLASIGDVFDCYEILMLSVFQMDCFSSCNKLSSHELLFAGLSIESYTSLIRPDDIPMTAYAEYRSWHTDGLSSEELRLLLRGLRKTFSTYGDNPQILKSAALFVEEALEEKKKCPVFSRKRHQYQKLIVSIDRTIASVLHKNKKDGAILRGSLITVPGNYTAGVEEFLTEINQNDMLERGKKYYEVKSNFSFMMEDFSKKVKEDIPHHNVFQDFKNRTVKVVY